MTLKALARKLIFVVAALAAGIMAAFAMPPASLWPLLFVGLSALYILYARTEKPMQAFAGGFFFGIGYFVTGLWWIGNALLIEGNEYAWVWPISVIGLPTLLSLFTGIFLALARLFSNPRTGRGFLYFAFFLTLSEWARGNAFTGFPWNLYGYTWADHLPMAQGFAVLGAYGMTLLTVLWAAAAGYIWVRADKPLFTRLAPAMLVIVTMTAFFTGGSIRLANNPTQFNRDAGLIVVQPNIPQTMKWNPDAAQDNFIKTVTLSEGARFGESAPRSLFIVWPETALAPSVYTQEDNIRRMQSMLDLYAPQDAYLVTGILHRNMDEETPTYTNSVAFLNHEMLMLAFYSKHHLVPFGEFIPFQDLIPLKPVVAFTGFERGEGAMTISRANVPPFTPLICYEVIFPDTAVQKANPVRPQWIVNVTNDGWYGDSAGPYQHFAQTRLRAIEEGLPAIRSANTGISGIIDPYGRVLDHAAINSEAALVSLLPRPAGIKPVFWPWAIQPVLFLAGLVITLRGLMRLRRHSKLS